ncbi:hypothetical protein [Pyruvatibacter sp.]|uniref:hypothetical protein n=1 Tax=Pyruvatibacter sp. TaxID=1981328 RepID=UPI00326305D7
MAAPHSTPDTWRAISTADYDAAETAALPQLSIPTMMGFQPAAFQSVNWPTNVRTDAELVRYVDHNFEAETKLMYEPQAEFAPVGFYNGFTETEAAMATQMRDKIAKMTAERFGRAVRPMSNLMVQFGPYRCMEALSAAYGRKLSIIEPGPGAGYLGALLAQAGYSYASYDVTQALYLWQSHLLDVTAEGAFTELAHKDADLTVDRSSVIHMPWWMFAQQFDDTPLRYDLVYSNSNLGEMNSMAFRQLMLFAKSAMQDSEVAAFTFFSPGMPRFHTIESVDAELQAFGFVPVMTSPFYCYQLAGRDPSKITEAFKDGIPHIGGTRAEATLDVNSVFATSQEEAPLDVRLTRWFHGWDAPVS